MQLPSFLKFLKFASFFRKSVIGLDIGTLSIKAVEITKKESGELMLSNYALFDNYQKIELILNSGEGIFLSNEAETAKLIQWLFKQAGIVTKDVNISIPASFAFTTLIEFPYMPDNEINKAVPYEARQYVPMPIAQVALDWSIIKEEGEGRVKVFLIAIPYEIIEKYKRIAQLAGLNLQALEFENLGTVRSLTRSDPLPSFIVDMGAHFTRVIAVYRGNIYSSKNIEFAGNSLTAAIASGAQIDYLRAESIKRDRGLRVFPQEAELKNLMLPLLDKIMSDIKRELEDAQRVIGKRIEKIVLCGGTATLAGLLEYAAPQFPEHSFSMGNPLKDIEVPSNVAANLRDKAHKFATAVGLALREFAQ